MATSDEAYQASKDAVDAQIRIALATHLHKNPSPEELAQVKEVFEEDIEQSTYVYGNHKLFCTRYVRDGLGFFHIEPGEEPFAVHRWLNSAI
ncbi:MAG: hypothetical protein KA175_08320 [Flavobacteriales bacterium]|nr:hypothetical protein [Flavobacteriales bacterium]